MENSPLWRVWPCAPIRGPSWFSDLEPLTEGIQGSPEDCWAVTSIEPKSFSKASPKEDRIVSKGDAKLRKKTYRETLPDSELMLILEDPKCPWGPSVEMGAYGAQVINGELSRAQTSGISVCLGTHPTILSLVRGYKMRIYVLGSGQSF